MSTARIFSCGTILAALLAAASPQSQAGADLASPWTELHAARVRLIAGPGVAKQSTSFLAGIEISLADGWKTYWRVPGDAGVPPVFDWAASDNVGAVKVLYPAPLRLSEPAAETIGYKGSMVFPVEVTPRDAAKPVVLKLTMEFGVCRDICIPSEAVMAVTIPAKGLSGPPLKPIAAALERVPRQQSARRSGDPDFKRVMATLDGSEARLVVEAAFPGGSNGAQLFVEAPDGLFVPMPTRTEQPDGVVRFASDLARGGNAKEFKGKVLTLTLVSESGATEMSWTVP
ncbi:MAG: hypothetical protein F9K29_15790 [Hyphomicrobiaceae bacterium]|nr:MAG: hypothetical protein F9K29_15790 [Hyphomicrobiaceae bacterium]